jgi:hypothetical protein
MTPAERRALQRLQRRAAELTPELVIAILKAMQLVRDRMPLGEVERLIRAGRITEAVNAAVPLEVLERALNPATNVLAEGVMRTARLTVPTLPTAARTIIADMNTLNPRVVDAVRALDTRQIRAMIPETQQAVRQTIEAGLQRGLNPRTVARSLQRTVGLAPNQEQAVRNFRAMLERGDNASALSRTLRDRRFDAAIRRGDLSPTQIDRMVDAYARRMRAFAAETHARTAALDAQKVGQQLAWDEAKASGALGDSEVVAVWVTAGDARVRDDHVAMNGEERDIDGTYSTGQRYPGEGEYNCRCTEIFRVRTPRFALAA